MLRVIVIQLNSSDVESRWLFQYIWKCESSPLFLWFTRFNTFSHLMQRTANENAAFSFAVLCIIVFKLSSTFWGRRSSQIRYAAHLWHGLAIIFFAGRFLFVRSFLSAATAWYSAFFLLSFITRFAFDIGQLAKICFEFHLRSSPSAFSEYMDDQSTIWLFSYLLHRADETQQGRNSCPRLQFLALDYITALPL